MNIEPKDNCPLDGFKPCRKLDCAWFIKVVGTNVNTGKEVEDWACSMAWLPILMIENSGQQRQTGAAIESFRNEMVKGSEMNTQILLASASGKLNVLEN
jgi:hypothetical protein